MRKTILIVDDHASFRRAAWMLLAAQGFEVVGEAFDGASAVGAVRQTRPQIVLLDVQLPDMRGFDATARIVDIAQAGEVMVADVVVRLAGTVPEVSPVEAGFHELRGFKEPISLYRLRWPEDQTIRVVIAEDSVLLRHGIARVVRDAGTTWLAR